MKTPLLPAALALATVGVVMMLGDTGSAGRAQPAYRAGDPARGALVWMTAGCGACHAFSKAGATGLKDGTAPNLDRYLVPHARRVKLAVELFAFSRIYWGGRGMTAFGWSLSGQEIDDLVSFVTGKPFSAPPGGVARVPPLPVPPPVVTVPAATVARWVKLGRLPQRAVQGAALFAKAGCLSCHIYLDSGTRRLRAPDLEGIGSTGRTARYFRQYVAQPYRYGNNLMPSYADLGTDSLDRIAAFLVASRGPR